MHDYRLFLIGATENTGVEINAAAECRCGNGGRNEYA